MIRNDIKIGFVADLWSLLLLSEISFIVWSTLESLGQYQSYIFVDEFYTGISILESLDNQCLQQKLPIKMNTFILFQDMARMNSLKNN